jgi:citrate synthase
VYSTKEIKVFSYNFSNVSPLIQKYTELCVSNSNIDPALYTTYDVKRGLRDISGKGVLAGLTEISEIESYVEENGKMIPCEGKLFYRGIDVNDITAGFLSDKRFGFEETCYLLLFGQLPTQSELSEFCDLLASYRTLPPTFVRDVIMKSPSDDLMNSLGRGVLTLFSFDDYPNDISLPNVLRQSLELTALMPLISVYSYQAKTYYHDGGSFFIHNALPEYSTAQNILHMLRPDSSFSEAEAAVLDMALVLHAEHGGGNNSTFTTHVVTSSGTDTYAAISAALASLKGPKHGGANIKVTQMFEDMKVTLSDWHDEDAVKDYLLKLLQKEGFDRTGLIYGMGHAVYSLSDPRANLLKKAVAALAKDKGLDDEYKLYQLIERLAPEAISEHRKIYKGVSANVDFYSGFAYSMLGLPQELYTPLFAISRIAGWSAHRMEELANQGKIIRPAYKAVQQRTEYINIKDRKN